MRIPIDIQEIEKRYTINSDGTVFDKDNKRFLRPIQTNLGHIQYRMIVGGKSKKVLAQRLVAEKYLPTTQSNMDIRHRDHNNANNNQSNLIWVTRRDVVLAGRNGDWHQSYNKEMHRMDSLPIELTTQPNQSLKPIQVTGRKIERFTSLTHCCSELNLSRTSVFRSIKSNRTHKGYNFEFV